MGYNGDPMNLFRPREKQSSRFIDSMWSKSVSIEAKELKSALHRAGLSRRDRAALSLERLERRRLQLWLPSVGLLIAALLGLILGGDDLLASLPTSMRSEYVAVGVAAILVLYGLYLVEKEFQLRRLTRHLIEQQFESDVLNKRLRSVETLLESATAVNTSGDVKLALENIVKQAERFIDETDICFYMAYGDDVSPHTGNTMQGLSATAVKAIEAKRSRFVKDEADPSSMLYAVPASSGGEQYGALCMRADASKLDPFEALMALSLFAEQIAATITLFRLNERQRVHDSREARRFSHDQMTGFLNRNAFIERLEAGILEYGEDAPRVAVLLIKIDNLEKINDNLGFPVGDAVVEHYASVIGALTEEPSLAGRFGDDSFVVALFDVSGYEEALEASDSIKTALRPTFLAAGRRLNVTSSMGVALPETFEINAVDLIRDAHAAVRDAWTKGGDHISRFDAHLSDAADREPDLGAELRRAIDNDEIGIDVQPIFQLDDRKFFALETFAQWRHPETGVVPAASFIPFIAESKQRAAIDQRVFHKSCATMRSFRDGGFAPSLHVNLSAGFLGATGVATVMRRTVEGTGVAPSSFVIEIDESSRIPEHDRSIGNIRELKGFGFRIALDNFGAGAFDFGLLHRLSFDYVKISPILINNLQDADHTAFNLVKSILEFAESQKLVVIATGVENDRQVEILRELGCQFGQGQFLSRSFKLKPLLDTHGGPPPDLPLHDRPAHPPA